jgi:hypothetical protein
MLDSHTSRICLVSVPLLSKCQKLLGNFNFPDIKVPLLLYLRMPNRAALNTHFTMLPTNHVPAFHPPVEGVDALVDGRYGRVLLGSGRII